MVLYLSIQLRLRYCYENKPKCLILFIKSQTDKNGNYLICSSYLEVLLNLMCTQLFSISIRKLTIKTPPLLQNHQRISIINCFDAD